MKKILLAIFVPLDLAILAAAGYVLYRRLTPPAVPSAASMGQGPLAPTKPAAARASSSGTMPGTPSQAPPTTPPAEPGVRKILFTYRNSKAGKVALRADFTGWKEEAMHRDAKGVWTYQADLTPGEYAYIFTVDDRSVRDLANKRVKRIGTTQVSAIVVTPKPAPPQKSR